MALRELVNEIGFRVDVGGLRRAQREGDRIIDRIADNFRDMGTDIDRVINNVGTSIRGLPDPRIDTSQSIRNFNNLQNEVEELRRELDRVQQEARQTDRALSDIDLGSLAGGIGGGAVGATVGLDITSFAQMERELQAGLGVDAGVASGLKGAIKAVWSDIPDISKEVAFESVVTANRYFDEIGEGAQRLGANMAMIFQQTGVEIDRIGQDAKLLTNRFEDIKTPEDAFNIFTTASQKLSPRLFDELLDQTEEYGARWAAAGVSANDFFAAMIAGGEDTIYVMDKIGDSIATEFLAGIRTGDEGKIETLGFLGTAEQVEQWRKDIVQGGEEGWEAAQGILGRFVELKDKGLQEAIGLELFGGLWDDQGPAMLPVFEQISKGYDDLGGNVEDLGVRNEGVLNTMKSGWRSFSAELDSIAGGAFGGLSEAIGAALPAVGAFLGAGGLGRVRELPGGLGPRLAPVGTFFRTTGPLVLGFGRALGVVVGIAGGAIGIIAGLGYAGYQLYQNWDEVKGWILGVFDSIGAGAKGMANSVIGGINGVIGALNGLSVDIPDWVPIYGGQSFGLNIPKIPMLAAGGIITSPGLALVGERGPELVNLPRGAQVNPLDTGLPRSLHYASASGGSPVFNSHITIEYHGTGSEADMKKLVAIIKKEQRKNHWALMEDYWKMVSLKVGLT
ncbi:hypothetical protein [Desulfallas thermosapovorans]|uniref:Phage-related minor tail protein n=1 Tax=Desulfallas thermosapovorans DSM 6562 TaxID=1121431 RepID=A0A5S4ZWB9_9FIRM|nr:hypothetical protein [Desulfallas thermosapovorans]TYO97039.1 hypothetical protein LX24_00852 [Desulfallas thermosapovorans DSM 6562]